MSKKFQTKQKARIHALQALYSWYISENNLQDIENHILDDKNLSKIDANYFKKLLHEVPANLSTINDLIKPHINIPLNKLDTIELIVLQIATFELTECKDIPFKVVINEALELNKKFGTVDGYKFVNGVLDKIVKELKE